MFLEKRRARLRVEPDDTTSRIRETFGAMAAAATARSVALRRRVLAPARRGRPAPRRPIADRATRVQLGLIRDLARAFARRHMRFWLRGGWALDFFLGRATGRHADVDLVTWLRHAKRVRELMLALGYAAVPTAAPHLKFRRHGQEVGIIFVVGAGRGRVRGVPTDWGWLPGAFLPAPRRLGAIACRVVSPRQLLAEKLSYERNTGRPLRPKDRRSIGALREVVAAIRGERRGAAPPQ